jgi:hypothetical protein
MTAFSPFPPVQKTDPERVLWVDVTRSLRIGRMAAVCAKGMAGLDVERSLRIAAADGAFWSDRWIAWTFGIPARFSCAQDRLAKARPRMDKFSR